MEEKQQEEEKELVMTINITLNDLIQSHKALFESYALSPEANESALFFFQTILEELTEDKDMKKIVDETYALKEKELKEYYKNCN